MGDLKERIVRLIETAGPITVADYMSTCLLDPADGYYTTREPFGVRGDFVTAPDISQMFGELLAVWLYSAWQAIGSPLPVSIAELGPGRGTLFRDMLKTLTTLNETFVRAASFHLIEASPKLIAIQRKTLANSGVTPSWHRSVAQLPRHPVLFVGNEIFDALPLHQYVRTSDGWRERRIGMTDDGELGFVLGAGVPDADDLPADEALAQTGDVVELAPARAALMDEIAGHIALPGGAGLFIDYGYAESAVGDTLQAVRDHKFESVFDRPGKADLTAHVDFCKLRQCVATHRLDSHLQDQGTFLLAMGLLERAGALGRNRNTAIQRQLQSEVDRLVDPRHMGELFKVFAVLPPGTSVHPFADPD